MAVTQCRGRCTVKADLGREPHICIVRTAPVNDLDMLATEMLLDDALIVVVLEVRSGTGGGTVGGLRRIQGAFVQLKLIFHSDWTRLAERIGGSQYSSGIEVLNVSCKVPMIPVIDPFRVRRARPNCRPYAATWTEDCRHQPVPVLRAEMVVGSPIERRVLPHFVDGLGLEERQTICAGARSRGGSKNGRVPLGGVCALPRIIDHAVRDHVGTFQVTGRDSARNCVLELAGRDRALSQ